MKRLVAYAAGVALAGTALAQAYYEDGAPIEARGGYPPCSATVTDRCIQLYEPGVATAANLALNERLGDGTALAAADVEPAEPYYAEADYAEAPVADEADYAAVGGPYEPVWSPDHAEGNWPARSGSDYPPCSPDPRDDRCIQLYENGVGSHWGWY